MLFDSSQMLFDVYILSLFDVYIHIPHMLFDSFHMLFDVPSLSCICILHYLRILLKAKLAVQDKH